MDLKTENWPSDAGEMNSANAFSINWKNTMQRVRKGKKPNKNVHDLRGIIKAAYKTKHLIWDLQFQRVSIPDLEQSCGRRTTECAHLGLQVGGSDGGWWRWHSLLKPQSPPQ